MVSAGCRLFDAGVSKREVMRINMTGEKSLDGNTACHICFFYRVGHDWWLKSVNKGSKGGQAIEMIDELKRTLIDLDPIAAKTKELSFQQQEEQQHQHAQTPEPVVVIATDVHVIPTSATAIAEHPVVVVGMPVVVVSMST